MSTQLAIFGDITASRHGGNANSNQAFEVIREHREPMREKCFSLIKRVGTGITLKEMALILNKAEHKISGRISELKALGRIEESGKSRDGHAVLVVKGE